MSGVVGMKNKSAKDGFDKTAGRDVIPLADIKPTQIAVGMLQVKAKQKALRKLAEKPEKLIQFLLEHPIPVVKGPEGKVYAIDHHHLACALMREKFKTVPTVQVADYSALSKADFWKKMEEMQYVHLHDEKGRLQSYKALPDSLADLKDDPYRSLAGLARQKGAFDKVHAPFSEFRWADYFRMNIPRKSVTRDFDKALANAAMLARDPAAYELPGYKASSASSAAFHP